MVFILLPGVERLLERPLHGHLPGDRSPPAQPCDHPRAHVAIPNALLPGECLRSLANATIITQQYNNDIYYHLFINYTFKYSLCSFVYAL